ncbi:unnamed protein product [[Actinomadura] parvosata subsp. kistnae]|nr:unnamed protein product [Actinomadura parvosata subsp. kistnae]
MATLIKDLLVRAGIEVALLESRTKSVASLEEKLARKGKAYGNPLEDIDDLTGIRIVTYYLEDVDEVESMLKRSFDLLPERCSRWTGEHLDRFGYRSNHYVLRIGEHRGSLDEWSEFRDMLAEVQVRTALQHAWSAISHKLAYKREDSVPRPLRRRLAMLSALFELADEQFSGLRADTDRLQGTYQRQVRDRRLDISIDPLSIAAFLSDVDVSRNLSAQVREAGWSVDGETVSEEQLRQDRTDLVTVADLLGLATIQDLEGVLAGQTVPLVLEALREVQEKAGEKAETSLEDLLARLLIVSARTIPDEALDIYATKIERGIRAVHRTFHSSREAS